MTFDEFIQDGERPHPLRNAHIYEPGICIYMRRPTRYTHNADFEMATLDADQPGSGALTAFMARYPEYTFYVENILNPRLVGFFERRGMRVIDTGSPDVCMISEGCWHFRDGTPRPEELKPGLKL